MKAPKLFNLKLDCTALGQKIEAIDDRNSRGCSQEELGSLEGLFRLQCNKLLIVEANYLMCSISVYHC